MMKFKSARGFSLIETGAMLAVVSLVGMVAAPAVKESRSKMRGVSSSANLQQIGQGAASYGFSNNGRLFSYTWRAGETYVVPGRHGPETFNSDQAAAAWQNVEILRRRTGRISGREKIRNLQSRLPHRRFSHLVLFDYLNESEKSTKFIDPSDTKQLFWAANPLEYLEIGNTLPYGHGGGDYSDYDNDPNWATRPVVQRWTFATSYQSVPAAWVPDYPNTTYAPVPNTPHLFSAVGGGQLQLSPGRNISEVKYTGQKVWMHEEFDREQAGDPYFAYNFARTEKLMFDLSVNNWASGAANSSRIEHYGGDVWRQTYVPLHQFSVPIGGLGDQAQLDQRFRWTFRGLGGVDYGVAEFRRGASRFDGD